VDAVRIEHLTRRFQRGAETVTALDDVSLDLRPGELTVTAGPSGSGKTTLLSIIAGFERADAGRVVLPFGPTGGTPEELTWRQLAFVPQGLALLDELTVRENVDVPALLDPSGAADLDRAGWDTDDLLERLEIAHLADRYPSLTSGGEQQRTSIARALVLRPPLLVADEPTGHQDRDRIELVMALLRAHAYAGNTVLISSHDEAVLALADRVLTLADGRVVSDASGAAVR
jgi:ABC-type lipoprotein export system ATPase subunit